MSEIPKQLQKSEFRFVLIKPKSKIPFEKDWQDTANYPYDHVKIKTHSGNLGVLTGIGNLIIFDCDCQEAENIARQLPTTLVVETSIAKDGFRKKHFYFKCPLQQKQILKDHDLHLGEIQALGQQVIIAGSVHPSGAKYEVLEDRPIAEISEKELLKAVSPFVETKKATTKRTEILAEEADPICAEIKKKIKVPDLLKKYGFDTSKNPTKCLWHESQGGKCFSYDDDLWNCFHCGNGGNIFHLVMKHEAVSFAEAKRKLAETVNIDISKKGTKLTIPAKPTIPDTNIIKAGGGIYSGFVIEPLGNFEYIYNTGKKKATIRAIQDTNTKLWTIDIEGKTYCFSGRPIERPLFKIPDRDKLVAYCNGELKIKKGNAVFNNVVRYLKLLYDVGEEKYYNMVALGACQSWLSSVLNSLFYVGFGAKRGSGKTCFIEGLTPISRHGFMVGNPTEAIARDIHNQQLSVFTDEIDKKRKGKDNELYQCFRQGYRRGNFYLRHKDRTYEPEVFDPFGFKGYTLHSDVEQALKTRTIMTPLRVSSDKKLPILNLWKEQLGTPVFEDLFFWYMENALNSGLTGITGIAGLAQNVCKSISSHEETQKIRQKLYDEITKGFSKEELKILGKFIGRNTELTYIAMLVCKAFGINVLDSIEGCIETKQVEEAEHSDHYLIELLKEKLIQTYEAGKENPDCILEKGEFGGCFYTKKIDVYAEFIALLKEKGLRPTSTATFTEYLRELGFEEEINVKMQKYKPEDCKQRKCLIFDDIVLKELGLQTEKPKSSEKPQWREDKLTKIAELVAANKIKRVADLENESLDKGIIPKDNSSEFWEILKKLIKEGRFKQHSPTEIQRIW